MWGKIPFLFCLNGSLLGRLKTKEWAGDEFPVLLILIPKMKT